MPTVTGAQLLAEVRQFADEPDDGAPTKAYITDDTIYTWLSDHYRNAVCAMARGGYPYAAAREEFASPGSTVTLTGDPLAITGVFALRGNHLLPLPRLDYPSEAFFASGTKAAYWQPQISTAGAFTLNLYPGESGGTIKVYYVPEMGALSVASSVHLSASWKRVVVLGAALDCYVKRSEYNKLLVDAYNDAVVKAEIEAAQYADNVVKNTDDTYPLPSLLEQYRHALNYNTYIVP